jgi:hypothetical protein
MRHLLAALASLVALPAVAQTADASAIPPPPYLADEGMVLFLFVAIFVAAAWSLAVFMQASPRPSRSFLRRNLF